MTEGEDDADGTDARLPGPPFDVPAHYGESGAMEALSGVAAPLLAAGTLALLGVVIQQPASLRWPGLALLLLTVAAVLLVTAVQCGFWARRHLARPDEMAAWWSGVPGDVRWRRLRDEQWSEQAVYRVWAGRCRAFYGAGITALWVGVAVAVLPESPLSLARAATLAIALAAAACELVWTLAVRARDSRVLRRVPGLLAVGEWLDPGPQRSAPPERWPWSKSTDPFRP